MMTFMCKVTVFRKGNFVLFQSTIVFVSTLSDNKIEVLFM